MLTICRKTSYSTRHIFSMCLNFCTAGKRYSSQSILLNMLQNDWRPIQTAVGLNLFSFIYCIRSRNCCVLIAGSSCRRFHRRIWLPSTAEMGTGCTDHSVEAALRVFVGVVSRRPQPALRRVVVQLSRATRQQSSQDDHSSKCAA